MTPGKIFTHHDVLVAEAQALAAALARAAHMEPIVPADPLADIDKVLDGDELCRRAAERQQDALEARDESLDRNGNARRYE